MSEGILAALIGNMGTVLGWALSAFSRPEKALVIVIGLS